MFWKLRIMKNSIASLISILVILVVAGVVSAQSDAFGAMDVVYIDSVAAGPGEDVSVKFNVKNDEVLSSLSIPVVYDPELLNLKTVSFTDSRAEYLGTKITAPDDVALANGHFMVAMVQIMEDPIPAGDGMVFTAVFTVSDSAELGQTAVIDSLFFPPGGELLLVGPTVMGQTSSTIRPEFVAGKVMIGGTNQAPVFAPLADQYIMEGDTLELDITVNDPNRDDITLAMTAKPSGATFVDNGDGSGRLTWVPDFVGPHSADGSPFAMGFWASDGDLSAERGLTIHVVNSNRAPQITAPATVNVPAGTAMSFTVSALDPDFEEVIWTVGGMPDGAEFDYGNPGTFVYNPSIVDTGAFTLEFVASDPKGMADTVRVDALVSPVALYTLSLDSVEAAPGEEIEFRLELDNALPVTSFNLLFNYDVSALTLLSVTNQGTRIEGFDYFNSTANENGIHGNVRILAVADIGGGTEPLGAGEGAIAVCRMRVSSDLAFSGMQIPVRFRFLDGPTNEDNTMTDSLGSLIRQEDIFHADGYVAIEDIGQVRIGDINLNGLSAEIGDVIYFTNHFINPVLYDFNVLQYANSDINLDGIGASVADLVALINLVVNGVSASKVEDGFDLTATFTHEPGSYGAAFGFESNVDMGAALVTLTTDAYVEADQVHCLQDQMTCDFRRNGNDITMLIYSLAGETMPAGETGLVTIDGLNEYVIESIEFGSAEGVMVHAEIAKNGSELPADFALEQNYPNPFNPETQIEFSLPTPSQVELAIYNVLGQQVKVLAAGELPAGTHSLTWNGTDEGNRAVASGIYLYRLQAGTNVFSRKMMLLK